MKIFSSEEMREIDKKAVLAGIPSLLLMEDAAVFTLRVLRYLYRPLPSEILLLCGKGNNGGDALALARLLSAEGCRPYLWCPFPAGPAPEGSPDAAAVNREIVRKLGLPLWEGDTPEARDFLERSPLIIDGLLGTGGRKIQGGILETIIRKLNTLEARVVSLDIPSGLITAANFDAEEETLAVRADVTVCFGGVKWENLWGAGREYSGRLFSSPLSFPPSLSRSIQSKINDPAPLPPRKERGYKKTFGDFLVIGGSLSYYGAPFFAASAVLKSGGGYVRAVLPESTAPTVAALCPELVLLPRPETASGSIEPGCLEALTEEAGKSRGVILGPGLGRDPEIRDSVRAFAEKFEGLLLLDGDALHHIAGAEKSLSRRKGTLILTPHPGELRALSGKSKEEIRKNPRAVVKETGTRYRAVVVFKQAETLIYFPDGRFFLNLSGNSALAVPGSGDILAGMIMGFTGLGLPLESAVCSAVYIHGLLGRKAGEKQGKDSTVAGDLLKELPAVMKQYRENPESLCRTEVETI